MAEWTLLLEPSGRAPFRFILEIDVGELPAVLVGSSTERDGIKWELNST
jgi:hypothetical protein